LSSQEIYHCITVRTRKALGRPDQSAPVPRLRRNQCRDR
jgi:hypothetical protein